MARLFGSEILGFAVLLWYVRRSENQEFTQGSMRALFASWVLGAIFMVIAQLDGQMNAMGWGTIGLYAVFIVWYGYYIFK